MKKLRYSESDLRQAIANNRSYARALRDLGLIAAGGNYQTLRSNIKKLGIDTSHMTGKGWLCNKTHDHNRRPLLSVLVYGSIENTYRLKIRLIKEGIKKHKCQKCQLVDWLDQPIPLELHHKDGDKLNNTIENLELLCPNCHTMTSNYRGKNKKLR